MTEHLQKILINGQEIEQIFYKDVAVATCEQIATWHGVSVYNVHRAYQRHVEEFVEGEDVFRLDFAEANQLELRVQVSPNGLLLFSEGGYLLLVKTMRDKLAWRVYRAMREAYFRERTRQQLSPWEQAHVHLTNLMGVGYQKLEGLILSARQDAMAHTDSVEQKFDARIKDEQEANDKHFKRIEKAQEHRDEDIQELKKTVDCMATVAAGPFPGIMVNSVRDYVRNRLEMLGLNRNKVPKLFLEAFRAYMREHYLCQNQCGAEIYKQEDLREAYDTAGFGTEEHRHLAGDERLEAEVDGFLNWCETHPKKRSEKSSFPRKVQSPRMYEPRSESA
jgi:hypothetical protein